jgi:hypothetical protein
VAEYPNWFAAIAQENFERFLTPLAGKDNLKFLQLGTFTGDASVWMLENILTGKDCWLIDVDTWEGAPNEPIQTAMDFDDVYATYKAKIEPYKNVYHFKSDTLSFLRGTRKDPDCDFIYVDAHHTSASALLDSELSWYYLKSGGLMAIDDYEWEHPDGIAIHAPKLGIAMFLDRHLGEFDTLAINSQAWIRKH